MKFFFLFFLALHISNSVAQSSCSSDKTEKVVLICERFMNADCATCWTMPLANPNETKNITLDWIAPSAAGDAAPLSAAASTDASYRLESLKIALPKEQLISQIKVQKSTYNIRVAHGLAFAGYIGASIELIKLPATKKTESALSAVLLLVETIPKGMADSPTERHLVRNMLVESWNIKPSSTKSEQKQQFLTRRSFSIPAGVNPDNLGVFGWVQGSNGKVLAAAQSKCIETK